MQRRGGSTRPIYGSGRCRVSPLSFQIFGKLSKGVIRTIYLILLLPVIPNSSPNPSSPKSSPTPEHSPTMAVHTNPPQKPLKTMAVESSTTSLSLVPCVISHPPPSSYSPRATRVKGRRVRKTMMLGRERLGLLLVVGEERAEGWEAGVF